MYRGNLDIVTANEVVSMNLAVVVLLMVYISLCVVIVGGWAFKTLDDIGIELDENDKDSILWWFLETKNDMGYVNLVDIGQDKEMISIIIALSCGVVCAGVMYDMTKWK